MESEEFAVQEMEIHSVEIFLIIEQAFSPERFHCDTFVYISKNACRS